MTEASEGTVCFVAAEERELTVLESKLGRARRLSRGVRYCAEGELSGRRVVLAADGPGPRLARRAAEAAVAGEKAPVLVSTGYCGSLDASLPVGDILIVTGVNGRTISVPQTRSKHQTGMVVSVDRVIGTAEGKAALSETRARAVEMEAEAVAEFAAGQGLPFYCVRVVTDGVNEDMPLDFNRYRDETGRFSRSRIAWAAVRRPGSALPALVRFDRECRRASRVLGEFLADCRFQ